MRVFNRNGISIGCLVFAGRTNVTDRQTDHATRSVTMGRIYVRSRTMRPNNVLCYVRYMLSPVRLSVCRLSVTLVRPTQAVEIFYNIFMELGTLAIH